jgi:hypothetical protein
MTGVFFNLPQAGRGEYPARPQDRTSLFFYFDLNLEAGIKPAASWDAPNPADRSSTVSQISGDHSSLYPVMQITDGFGWGNAASK